MKCLRDMKIISIDPSSNTGIYIYTQKKQLFFTAEFKKTKESNHFEVLRKILMYFSKLAKNKFDLLIIEGYSYNSKNSRSVTSQAEIGGIIRSCFAAYSTPIIEIQIQSWKSATGIRLKKNKKVEKENYLREFNLRYSFFLKQIGIISKSFPHNPDEADAFLFFYTLLANANGQLILKESSLLAKELKRNNIYF